MRLGIFGGSFNPIHQGHLKLAAHAMSELNLDRVIFVPSCHTPLKDKETLFSPGLRLKLVREAIRGHQAFDVSRAEIDRKGFSYTVDTLAYFKKKFPRAVLYFLSGADTPSNVSRWKSFDKVLKLCRFVVAGRQGYRPKIKAPFLFMPFDALPFSSSAIRRDLMRGRKPKGLTRHADEILNATKNFRAQRRNRSKPTTK